jgi:hypothetical protein
MLATGVYSRHATVLFNFLSLDRNRWRHIINLHGLTIYHGSIDNNGPLMPIVDNINYIKVYGALCIYYTVAILS